MPEPTFDVAAAHRWMAIEANNGAWDLIEQPTRTANELARLLHLAHASCWHWSQVGKPIHQLRGLTLLTTAYVTAGVPEAAVQFGEQCLRLMAEVGDATPFDRACVHGSLAAAYRDVGRAADSSRATATAQEIVGSLDADDRGVFDKLYPQR